MPPYYGTAVGDSKLSIVCTPLERIDQYAFYSLGKGLRALASIEGDIRPSDVLWQLFDARGSYLKSSERETDTRLPPERRLAPEA
jgi:hypothetical protein